MEIQLLSEKILKNGEWRAEWKDLLISFRPTPYVLKLLDAMARRTSKNSRVELAALEILVHFAKHGQAARGILGRLQQRSQRMRKRINRILREASLKINLTKVASGPSYGTITQQARSPEPRPAAGSFINRNPPTRRRGGKHIRS